MPANRYNVIHGERNKRRSEYAAIAVDLKAQ